MVCGLLFIYNIYTEDNFRIFAYLIGLSQTEWSDRPLLR